MALVESRIDNITGCILVRMRSIVTIDDDLLRMDKELTGIDEEATLLREALKALIQRESARRLAALSGTMPEVQRIPRRRVYAKTPLRVP